MGEGYARNELYNLFRGRRHWIIKIIWILKKKYNVILGKKNFGLPELTYLILNPSFIKEFFSIQKLKLLLFILFYSLNLKFS
jgi:hypothetical protein